MAENKTSNQDGDLVHSGEKEYLTTQDIFKGRREVIIKHDSQDYRLRITKQNKLILNK